MEINEIFAQLGESHFRDGERRVERALDGEQLVEPVFAVERDDLVAHFLGGGVKRDRQVDPDLIARALAG